MYRILHMIHRILFTLENNVHPVSQESTVSETFKIQRHTSFSVREMFEKVRFLSYLCVYF